MALPKLFNRIFWHNNTTPAINEDNLNSMSKAIDDIDNRVIDLADSVTQDIPELEEDIEEVRQLVNDADALKTQVQGYADDASDSADDAANSATAAASKVLDSEAYALGTRNGVPVTSGDPAYQNNSKYYSQESSEDAEA